MQLSLPEKFPLVYFGFLYLPVSLVCNFHPDTKWGGVATYLGSLVQLCCGGRALQTNTTCICRECVHWMDHSGFATAQGSVYFLRPHCSGSMVLYKGTIPSGPCALCIPRSNTLRFSGSLQGHRPRWAVCFVPFPGSSRSGDWVLGKHTVPGGPCILFTSPVLAPRFPRCAVRAQSQVCHVSPLGS